MLPKSQKPRPELQVPVLHFPLSSPISEEISSPSCSSAEDQDEQIRPFAFLSKATRQKIEAQTAQRESRRESSRLNFRGITKNRKSVAKPVGLNLVTDFTLGPAPASKKHMAANVEGTAAPFVDLNDLQLLSKAREKERLAQKSKFTYRKRVSHGFQPMPDEPEHTHDAAENGGTFLNTDVGDPFHDRHEHALSPSDRNVMIGLTVPHDESIERSKERDDPGTPLTPSILITPANEEALWKNHSSTSAEMLRPRVASSVYSQPTPRISQFDSDIPPVPAIPAQHSGIHSGFGGQSKTMHAETRVERPTSIDTWEDASLPPTPRSKGQTLSVNADLEADRPQSQGWWNVLLSPLLGRSIKSPVSPSFHRNLPSTPSISTLPAREAPKDWPREKEVSCFSPDTPATPGLIGEDARTGWHEREKEVSCFSPDTPETAAPMAEKAFEFTQSMDGEKYDQFQPQERHQSPPPAYVSNAPSRQNTMSFMFNNGQTIQGEAAEYYQACAHELFSKTPYFQCVDHVCSLTPVNVPIPPGADGNRNMAFAAVDPSNANDGMSVFEEARGNTNGPVADATTSTKDAGLLIDIDSPRPTSIAPTTAPTTAPSGYAMRAKEIQVDSPASATTVDSWDSAITSDDEKSAAPAPAPISRKPVPAPASIGSMERGIPEQPSPAPTAIPMPEPTPAPAPAQVPPQIITNVSPPVINVHYPPHPEPQAQPQPIVVPQYVPAFPPSQPGPPVEPFLQEPMGQEQQSHEQPRGIPDMPVAEQTRPVSAAKTEWPWGHQGQTQPSPQPQPQVQTQVQTQAQKSNSQELFKDFEWAYDQNEPQQAAVGTRALPQDTQASHEPGRNGTIRRAPSQRPNNLQAPLVVQGRQSGSGWPFAQNAHPHSNAPPVAPGPQTLPDRPEAQYQQRQSPEQSSPVEGQVARSDMHTGERGLPGSSGLDAARGQSRDPEPISPGFQRAAGGPGSIPMADMPAPAPAYSQHSRHSSVPPQYGLHPPYQSNYVENATTVNPSGAIGPHEARRRRLEDEEKIGRKACGLRGLFKMKNGRAGREGRTRRRWYFLICLFFFTIVLIAIILAVTLTRKGASSVVQSRWLNLTGYPPMPTGIATLAGTEPLLEKSTCITPSSMWSCALPKSQQEANEPYDANQPNFRVSILFKNGTYDNSTTVASSTSSRRIKRDGQFDPSPAAPGKSDQSFIGQYTDNNTAPYAGEETPFFMSMLSPVPLASTNIYRRAATSNTTSSNNISAIIPAPDENSDGSAAAAMLYPLPSAQPVRLYNRGQSNEHYGFYTYYDKSIFLTSQETVITADSNGGTTKEKAKYRCTWSQTRLLVQIWTQGDKMNRQLLPYSNATATSTSSTATPTSTSTTPTSSSSATDFSRPGSFPYPVTITVDRHGGAARKKMVYCYPLEGDGHYNITGVQLQLEDRGIGGELVSPAGGLFEGVGVSNNSTAEDYGGC
ncbi:hypothetical protein N7541_003611 [Penicillium brevicompactum]|uniref:Glycoprotease family protein n=1 Tax=Penicillium brevicompactum TaxID=5074 RepID=A0A9W9RM57_PENBR|nr:hypothetical protein N7541_003611 [Penicillium brevicompactum]